MWYEQPTERQFRGSIVQLFSQGIRYGIATIHEYKRMKGAILSAAKTRLWEHGPVRPSDL